MKIPKRFTVDVEFMEEMEGYSCFFAWVRELPGVMTTADSIKELGKALEDSISYEMESLIKYNQELPEYVEI